MTSRDNTDNNDNQSDPNTNNDSQPFACRDEQGFTNSSSIKDTEPVINPNLHTPLQSNKKHQIQHEQQQIINRLKVQMSAMISIIKSLSGVMEVIVNDLSDQYRNFELLNDNIKFLQIGFKTKSEISNKL